jgi:acetyl-CoA carboxylase carboxyl transferase subunit alpha
MQQFSIYSVISPEGCASILWKSQKAIESAAKALKLTANELLKLNLIDGIIPEPVGGAHVDWDKAAENIAGHIEKNLNELKTIQLEELTELRYQKYRTIGVFDENKEQ